MNRIFRLVWNRALGTVQVASELARAPRSGAHAVTDAPAPRHRALALACAAALGLALPIAPARAGCVVQSISATGTAGTAGTDGANGHVGGSGGVGTDGGDAASAGGGASYCIDADKQALGGGGGTGGNGGDSSGFTGIPATGGRGGNGGNGGEGIRGTGGFLLANLGSVTGGTGGTGGIAGLGMTADGFGGMGGTGGTGGTALDASGFTLINTGSVTGGAGGMGGRGGFRSAGGSYGTGGTGGQGAAAVRATGANTTINNTGSITGGAGGVSGRDFYGYANSGNGGAAVTGDSFQLLNHGSIAGGAGGDGGDAYLNGTNGNGGRGGEGVLGANLLIANAGTISGGQGGGTGPTSGLPGRAGTAGDAIHFVGTGNNTLQLLSGSAINGAIEIDNGTSASINVTDPGLDLSGGTLGSDALLLNGTAQVDVSGAAFSISGNIRGDGTLNASGANTLTLGMVNLHGLNSSAATVLTQSVTTNGGGQTYSAPLLLGAHAATIDTQGGTLSFAAIDGPYDLTADTGGSIFFNGAIGASQALGNLTASHASQITLGGNVSTGGYQLYGGPVALSGNVTSRAASGTIDFDSTVDGRFVLDVNAGGTITFHQAVGGQLPLAGLRTGGAGGTELGANVITFGGGQSYGNALRIDADLGLTNLGGGNIDFGASLDGTHNLGISTGGTTTFQGAVGAIDPLLNIIVGSAGITLNQPWNIAGNATLNSTGGISQGSGAVLSASMLTGSAAGVVNLAASANAIQYIGPFSANGFNLLNNQNLAVFNGSTLDSGTRSAWLGTTSGNIYVNRDATVTGANIVLAPAGFTDLSGTLSTTGTISLGSPLQVRTGSAIAGNVANEGGIDFFNTDTITLAGTISGSHYLYVHSGQTVLQGANTYTGDTTVSTGGTLALAGSGGIANSSTVLVGSTGTLDISATSSGATLGTLAGSGKVLLGGRSLTLGNAGDTFKGVISGSGGVVLAGGTEIFTGANTYTGLTTIYGLGTLQLGTGGALAGNVANSGKLVFNTNQNTSFAGAISGTGALTVQNTGIVTLTGNNTYTGNTTINAGSVLQLGDGSSGGSIAGNATVNGELRFFNQNNFLAYAGAIGGSGKLTKQGAAILVLDGRSGGYNGQVDVTDGVLFVGSAAGNGAALGGSITVRGGAMLAGQGTVGSAGKTLNVQSGGVLSAGDALAPGGAGGTLHIAGNLSAAQGSILDLQYDAPGADFRTAGIGNSLVVSGNVALNGAIANITNAGGMGPGLYNLLSYGGTLSLSNGGVVLGDTAGRTVALQYLAAQKQVNLIDTTGLVLGFWNANGLASSTRMGGGNGTWSNTSPVWTDATGSVPASAMQPQPGMAVFGGAPGTVTVDGSAGAVAATGLQFATGGYTLAGDALALIGSGGIAPVIRVGDGSSAGAGMTAVIDNVLTGTDGLTKSDLGTLVLAGDNSYTGGTAIAAGSLQIGNGGTHGSVAGDVVDNGTLAFKRSDAVAFGGTISGSGNLAQAGSGTLTLTGSHSYTGATRIDAGTLALSGNGSIAASSGVADNGIFDISATSAGASIASLSGSGTVVLGSRGLTLTSAHDTFDGQIQGGGSLRIAGGKLTLSYANGYTGGTLIDVGATLQVGNGGYNGSIIGDVANQGELVYALLNISALYGKVSGTGSVRVASGGLALAGDNTYTGGTVVDAGAELYVGFGGNQGSLIGNVVNNGMVMFDRGNASSFGGAMSGSGNVVQYSGGTLTLSGNNTYTGTTLINSGTLALAGAGSIAASSAVYNAGGFDISGTDHGASVIDLYGTGAVNLGARTLTLTHASGRIDGIVSGSGGLTVAGGKAILGNDNSYTGLTTIAAAGALQLGAGGSTGSVAGDIANDGAVQFVHANDVAFGGRISGSGRLIQNGGGTLTLTADNGYTGGTAINSGSLRIGNGGATGAIVGDILDNAALVFDRADTLSYAGAISGTGTLQQQGAGLLVLTGNSSYTGGTTIGSGSLQIGNGGSTGAIAGDIANQGRLVFDRSGSVSINGVLSGQGELVQQGSGRLVVDSNSYGFAGHTTVAGGSLSIGSAAGNGAALGGDVTVQSGAALGGHGLVYGSVSLQAGSSLAPGSGDSTLTVHGDLAAAQGSRFDFRFGAPGATFQVPGTGDSVQVDGNVALDGVQLNIADAGGMGPGLYKVLGYGGTLTRTNGGLFVDGAMGPGYTLQFLTAQKQVNLIDTAGLSLGFWNADGQASSTRMGGGSGTWSASMPLWTDASGAVPNSAMQPQPGMAVFGGSAGTVTVDNSGGQVVAQGLQFAADGYVLAGDALHLAGASGAAPIVRVGDGSSAGAGMTATIANVLTGSDGLAKNDLGTLLLTADNTYSGGTSINAGRLQLGNGGTGGMIAGDVANRGTLAFDRGDDVAFAGAISGTGALAQLGSGSVTLTGDNSYSGGTTIANGTLRIGDGGGHGSIAGDVRNDGALVFDRADTLGFAGKISGQGTLTQAGAGMLVLNGDSSAFAGSTTVRAGTLEVGDAATPSAVLGGNVTVANGATLRGHGSIGGNVASAGTVWAGGSIGTLTIKGDYTQSANGALKLDALPDGQASLLAVGGRAQLAGSALVLAGTGAWSPQTSYTILTAGGGVAGQFASVQSSLAFLTPTLSYGANAVKLSLQRNNIDFAAVAQTRNQLAVASAANGLDPDHPVYGALVTLDAPGARRAFEQLDGQIHASLRNAIMDDERYVRDAVNEHLLDWNQGNGSREGRTEDGTAVWTAAWAHGGSQDGDGNASALDGSGGGLLLGVDTVVADGARVGGLVGTGDLTGNLGALASSARGHTRHAGLYGSVQLGGFRVMGGAIYGWQKLSTRRGIALPGLASQANANYDAQTVQGYVDGSYAFALDHYTLAPFVNVAAQRLRTDAFAETGTAALDGNRQSGTRTYGTLGVRGAVQIDDRGTVQAHASVGWQHAWGNVVAESALRFAGTGAAFVTHGTPVARHAAVMSAGLQFTVTPRLTLDVSYDGQFARRADNQSGRLSLSYAF